MTSKFRFLALAAALAIQVNASAQTVRIEITSAGFARSAEQTVVHEARCGDRSYWLRVSQKPAKVEFESSRQRSVLDISHTPFALALVKRSHWGEVHMMCPEGGLHATFMGYQHIKGKAALPFAFGVSIFDDGEVRDHDGLNKVAAGRVKMHIDRMVD